MYLSQWFLLCDGDDAVGVQTEDETDKEKTEAQAQQDSSPRPVHPEWERYMTVYTVTFYMKVVHSEWERYMTLHTVTFLHESGTL